MQGRCLLFPAIVIGVLSVVAQSASSEEVAVAGSLELLSRLNDVETAIQRLDMRYDELSRLPATQIEPNSDSLEAIRHDLCCLWNTQPIWQPYFQASFRGGGIREIGRGDLFVPLAWNDYQLLFADVRGQTSDNGHHEGNFGLAYRQLLSSDWIVGAYAFYDVRESALGNHFDQITFGLEAMNLDWDVRANAYLPDTTAAQPAGAPTAVISGGTIVVRTGEERAYWGMDVEFGRLLYAMRGPLDGEVRAFLGGYFFNNSAPGFENIAGPRARLETRVYDLPVLGEGSRLTAGADYQYDSVRGSQMDASLLVRIPFGPRPGYRLSLLRRRMVDRIVRDVDIIVNNQSVDQPANFAGTTRRIRSARVVDSSDTLDTEVTAAGEDSVVVIDGSAGTVTTSTVAILESGQAVVGGGSTLEVTGRITGTRATFAAPGTRPIIHGTDSLEDIFDLADDSQIRNLDIKGGFDAVFGDGVTGVVVADNSIIGAADDGIDLNGTSSGSVLRNSLTGNDGSGFEFSTFSGTVNENIAMSNDVDGFGGLAATFTSGTFAENTATNNGDDGFDFTTFTGGLFDSNVASDNSSYGFEFSGISGGILSRNSATDNLADGFHVFASSGGFSAGTMTNNFAARNTADGFDVDGFSGTALFELNNSVSNGDLGYEFTGAGGTASGNTGHSNTSGGDTFP